jgi:hypothetical protein|nr:MAG TPA: hypothetical protein [Bacteriophage sp.]
MFKKLTVTLLTLTTIFSGISAYNTTRTAAEPVKAVSRQNSATETNNRKLDYSAEQDYSYADAFVCDIVDWNTNGEELSLMTSDGYEFYSYKSADEYDFNKAYVALDDITDVEKAEGKIRIYTKDGTIYQVFGE